MWPSLKTGSLQMYFSEWSHNETVLDLGWALNPMTSIMKEKGGRSETQTLRRESHVKKDAKIRMMCWAAKGHQGLLAATGDYKRAWDRFCSRGSQGNNPADPSISDIWPLGWWRGKVTKFLVPHYRHPMKLTPPTPMYWHTCHAQVALNCKLMTAGSWSYSLISSPRAVAGIY